MFHQRGASAPLFFLLHWVFPRSGPLHLCPLLFPRRFSLNKSISLLAGAFALLLTAGGASAQTPASTTVVSGNGQLICQCQFGGSYIEFFFRPLVVKVTDTTGAPLANVTVNWAITNGGFNGTLGSSQTT